MHSCLPAKKFLWPSVMRVTIFVRERDLRIPFTGPASLFSERTRQPRRRLFHGYAAAVVSRAVSLPLHKVSSRDLRSKMLRTYGWVVHREKRSLVNRSTPSGQLPMLQNHRSSFCATKPFA